MKQKRKEKGNFCNAQVLLILIYSGKINKITEINNNNFILLENHSVDCINNNFRK